MRIKIELRRLREFLRLYSGTRMPDRELAGATLLSRNTVSRLRKHLTNIDFDLSDIDVIDNDVLLQRLQLTPCQGYRLKPIPDWGWVHTELCDPDVTLELLWREWRASEPNGIAYSQFTAGYREFSKQRPLVMRQLHLPGKKGFLDFCGKTIPVYLPNEQEPRMAQIFIEVLGYSNYTFACAVWTQQVRDWIQCNIDALNFFGGVPEMLVPDNLKSAVIKHTKDEVQLNQIYRLFAQHYQTVIIPARRYRPKDKAKVEAGVRIIQRWLLAALRHQRFFSLEELNQAISRLLEEFNLRPFKRLREQSRKSLFEAHERAALAALPLQPYEHADWRFHIRVRSDYSVEYAGRHYSVPSRLVQQKVDIRATHALIEVFHNHLRVASHERKDNTPGFSVHREHQPLNHQLHADNAPDVLIQWGSTVGPAVAAHLHYHLHERGDLANGQKAASALRRAAREHGEARLEEACAYALTLNTFALKSVQSILREQPDKRPGRQPSKQPIPAPHENPRGADYFAAKEDKTDAEPANHE